jgi:hypothetical protein
MREVMDKEELSIAMQKIKDVSDRLTANQNKSIERLIEKSDKKIETKINDACKRLTEKTIAEIKDRLEIVSNSEKVAEDIRHLKRVTEDLIDRHTILTEVAYMARQRLDAVGQARVNAELIKSMDFNADWFRKRNDLSLNKLFQMYHNGVEPDPVNEE